MRPFRGKTARPDFCKRKENLMASVFTKIINGEIPGNFVWQDEQCVVFATIEPRSDGHMLVVPREEVDNYLDADPDLIAHLSQVAQIIGQAGRDAFNVSRALIVVAGFDVPHLHIHVIPTDSMQVLHPDAKAAGVADGIKASCEKLRSALVEMGYSAKVPASLESLG
ncbi:HIT family protein [Mobiluncus curtisii]|uniref:HIT family protein n=1 Tax=Mobiluncus curtisii TaxID=2051 RepID=UPI001470450B|nr:HIT family protein [Mobiluncus curtisii]NMW43301.1 HIT family protein [Mobiluncus curtisii]NMW82755.1 HIT family protein [Mobiluncus curtisii]NMX04584.1 HIT family protein [Mobiluncus curtisii]